jgi:hypothetical protein
MLAALEGIVAYSHHYGISVPPCAFRNFTWLSFFEFCPDLDTITVQTKLCYYTVIYTSHFVSLLSPRFLS